MNSTGVLYFYTTTLDQSMKDLAQNPAATFTLTEAQLDVCEARGLDPEDPPCARLVLSGVFEEVTDEAEISFAKKALFSRHPNFKGYPEDHDWYFGKIVPTNVWLINIYGGATDVPVDEYFAVTDKDLAAVAERIETAFKGALAHK